MGAVEASEHASPLYHSLDVDLPSAAGGRAIGMPFRVTLDKNPKLHLALAHKAVDLHTIRDVI
jgi:hypothetical protein